MPLLEVVGNAVSVAPEQIGATAVNVGVIFGLTVTVKLVESAHWPAAGVNVYVPEFVLLTTDGFHVPVMPLPDVAGKEGTAAPAQIVRDVPKLNVGTVFKFTFTLNVVGTAH